MFVLRVVGAVLTLVVAVALLLFGGQPSPVTLTLAGFLVVTTVIQIWLIRAELRDGLRNTYSGVLETGSGAAAMPKLEMGDSGAILMWAGPQGQPMISIFNDCHVTIEIRRNRLTKRRRLLVSRQVRKCAGWPCCRTSAEPVAD